MGNGITFCGSVYKIHFYKKFITNMIIKKPMLSNVFKSWHKIKTESDAFDGKISVFSENKEEAYYILTPNFMEEILKVFKEYDGQISFSFYNSYLYIAINDFNDNFNIKMFNPIDISLTDNFDCLLKQVENLIEELKLDNQVFRSC